MSKIKSEIDVLKGLLIIFVVIGHSSWKYVDIIFWFHMPVFFMISGYLLNIPPKKEIMQWIKRKFKRYIVPYFSYFWLNYLLVGKKDLDCLKKSVSEIVFGGRRIGGVYWFITCLLLSLILIVLIENFVSKKKIKIIIYVSMYLLAIFESKFIISQIYLTFPWNADVCLLAVPYIIVGYCGQKHIEMRLNSNCRLKNMLCWISVIISMTLFELYNKGIYIFEIDMKYTRYNHIILCMLVPICIGLLLYIFAIWISRIKVINVILSAIGKSSLEIMYIHQAVKTVVMIPIFGEKYSIILWVIISSIIGIIFRMSVNQSKILKMLFQGG